MSLQEVIDILYQFVREKFDIGDDPEYTAEVNLFDYGFIDSMEAMEIISYVEERFQVEITQKDIVLYPMNSVAEIAAVVSGKLR
jgi:D-alanine--poly(phosphoribitol) ligase subunit 2